MQFDPRSFNKSNDGLYVAIKNISVDGKNNPVVMGIYNNFYDAERAGPNVQGPFFVRKNIFPKPRFFPDGLLNKK